MKLATFDVSKSYASFSPLKPSRRNDGAVKRTSGIGKNGEGWAN
jgi:hypothetical protein